MGKMKRKLAAFRQSDSSRPRDSASASSSSSASTPAPTQPDRPSLRQRSGSLEVAQPKQQEQQQHPLVHALRRIDPLLQFLCKATGEVFVPLPLLQKSLPGVTLDELQTLQGYGVLRLVQETEEDDHTNTKVSGETSKNVPTWKVGFPPPPLTVEATGSTSIQQSEQCKQVRTGSKTKLLPPLLLHGSTKRAAQQRLKWLQRQLLEVMQYTNDPSTSPVVAAPALATTVAVTPVDPLGPEVVATDAQTMHSLNHSSLRSGWTGTPPRKMSKVFLENQEKDVDTFETEQQQAEKEAVQTLRRLMKWHGEPSLDQAVVPSGRPGSSVMIEDILPRQISFAGSQPGQEALYASLSSDLSVPKDIYEALVPHGRQLYRHQVEAIDAALQGKHVSITTGTGSGKSLAFLLPVLVTVVRENKTAILLFPTKALAQDQYIKLQKLASLLDDAHAMRPATLDGDTPHSQRKVVAESCNIILTNPDTLHAAILPNWEKGYSSLLSKLAFVVVDEAHTYQGIFGAHVALILARLRRLRAVAQSRSMESGEDRPRLRFIAASATLPWPEIHVRKLCPIAENEPVEVIEDDASPRAAKHFFVWNPPLLSAQGVSSGSVMVPRKSREMRRDTEDSSASPPSSEMSSLDVSTGDSKSEKKDEYVLEALKKSEQKHREPEWHRRHAAEETALLLARAISRGVRCMAFAKTRNLVEWIYERTVAALKAQTSTCDLVNKVESYRGGYTRAERWKIEELLFRNELIGVVGTNALELGVDVGGIDLTLHCGYPSSYTSLLQQAGRAGRGLSRSTSCSIVVCFNSPSEQHLWRYPTALLSRGLSPADTIPLTKATIRGHILCASNEFPLTGSLSAECIVDEKQHGEDSISDCNLFGGQELYLDAVRELVASNHCISEEVALPFDESLTLFKAHASMKKAWSLVSIRSIEPVNYSIVNIGHPGQSGRKDRIYSEEAVLDILPYSRVFYHAHPGAIITHRGSRYKVVSMTRPPDFVDSNQYNCRNVQLSAFAKPTSARYSTRPLSRMNITVVKPFETITLREDGCKRTNAVAASFQRESSSPRKTCNAGGSVSVCTSRAHDVVDVEHRKRFSVAEVEGDSKDEEICFTSFCGCGVVNVKRTVHGYKKLSLITRTEISRSELSLPDMEFETFGLWFDTEPDLLTPFLGPQYGPGVHALSHAILAVAPLFDPGLVREDLECDHTYVAPTRLCLFDERAGDSGSCNRLWPHFFVPENNIMDAALDLLRNCDTCIADQGYEGGCPACLHASQCLKFNMHLSRSGAIVIGKRLLDRIKTTELFKTNERSWRQSGQLPPSPSRNLTPRRKARREAVTRAKEIRTAQNRQFVIGRPAFVRTEGAVLFDGEHQEHA